MSQTIQSKRGREKFCHEGYLYQLDKLSRLRHGTSLSVGDAIERLLRIVSEYGDINEVEYLRAIAQSLSN